MSSNNARRKKDKLKLSERLENISSRVSKGERVADVGTDHGFLPIALYERGISEKIILSDIREGPLEKARGNVERFLPERRPGALELRLGSGLETLDRGEVDTAVIAGMGGLLIIKILEAEPEKTGSIKKFILQPRNAGDKLRKWLILNGFAISRDELVMEGSHFCEVMSAKRGVQDFHALGGLLPGKTGSYSELGLVWEEGYMGIQTLIHVMSVLHAHDMYFDMSIGLVVKKDGLLAKWLEKNISKLDGIIENLHNAKSERDSMIKNTEEKRAVYEYVLKMIY